MNRWLVAALMVAAVLSTTMPNAAADPDCIQPIPDLFERLSPSVVSISAVELDASDGDNRVNFVGGSGFIVDDDGLVLTNSHVIFGHQAIVVTLADGRQVEPKLIGITTSMVSDAQNIGFAVPINVANQVIPELVKHGRVIRLWFGMTVKLISKTLREIINMPLVEGLLVEKVDPGSPAQQAGIREGSLPVTVAGEEFLLGGDIITEMNGQSPNNPEGFAQLVSSLTVGGTVHLTLYRDKQTRQVRFKLLERPILPGDVQPNATSTRLHRKFN